MTQDFFYSGHVGFTTFCALENYSLQKYSLAALAAFSTCFEFMVLLFTRSHYTIDLITGIVMAHYFWVLSGRLSKLMDPYIAPRRAQVYAALQGQLRP
jgi:ABC-type enterochelin transport system permease subunit